ncbi:TonB-dependent receptor domain-containing protein [Sphingomonas sp. RS6]
MRTDGLKALLAGVATGALVLAAGAQAQTQAAGQDGGSAVEDLVSDDQEQAIVVTGSRIRGVNATGSNVIAIDEVRIAQEPVSSAADLLRRVPQVVSLGANPAGGSAQNGAANVTRSAGINLRGLGNTATLLLYDGKRLPAQGTQGQVIDPSVIPTIAIQRVEVVADGASAIYGSDAVAGVVNFLPRRNFSGVELRGRAGVTGDGGYNEQQLSGIIGHRWEGGWGVVAAEYTRNSALLGSDLPFYQNDNRSRGGRDLRTSFCNPGTISVGGNSYAIPAGGVTAGNADALIAGTSNKCFYGDAASVFPSQQRVSVSTSWSQRLSGSVRLFADGFYSYRDGISTSVPEITANVPSTNPFFVSPVPGASGVSVTYSPYLESGAIRNPFHAYSWNVSGGVEADLFGDIQATAYYAHGESKDVADNRRGVNGGAVAAALADTNPATALNVFGEANNPATLASILDNYFVIRGDSRLDVANLQFSGSLLAMPGGRLRFAIGGEYRREYTFTDLTVGSSAAQAHIGDSGARTVKALFGELFVPIFGAENSQAGLREFSLSLAARHEQYSDFGSTTNPKIGIVYRPVEDIRFRASYGRSFRAPSFTEVSQRAGGAGLYAQTLPSANGALTGIAIGGGNPDLDPETAKTWSAGVQIQPSFLPGFSIESTYFNILYRNQIQALFGNQSLLTDPIYAAYVTLDPTPAQVAALTGSGLPINGTLPSDPAFIVDGRRQNLGAAKVSGIDFQASYAWEWAGWKLSSGVAGTYFTRYDFQSVPGGAYSDVLGTINFPQQFRLQGDLGVERGGFTARLTLNHLSGYSNTAISPAQHVSAYDTVDAYIGTKVGDRLTLALQARNLFNRYPPFVDISGGYDPQSANPLPRMLIASAGVSF